MSSTDPLREPLPRGGPDATLQLALVAHDEKKDDLLALARRHLDTLARVRIVATGTTGGRLRDELGLSVERMRSGPLGGDLQIGARIAEGHVDAVIFLRDALTAHPHEPDIQALLKVCDTRSIPVATNQAMAGLLLEAIGRRLTAP